MGPMLVIAANKMSKVDVRAAIDAADDWADTNAVAFNLALPVVARNNLTATEKAALLMYVVQKRYLG